MQFAEWMPGVQNGRMCMVYHVDQHKPVGAVPHTASREAVAALFHVPPEHCNIAYFSDDDDGVWGCWEIADH